MVSLMFKLDTINYFLSGYDKGAKWQGQWVDKDGDLLNWSAEKKESLIDEYNPNWDDLGADWFDAK